jgi:hypothetical protein
MFHIFSGFNSISCAIVNTYESKFTSLERLSINVALSCTLYENVNVHYSHYKTFCHSSHIVNVNMFSLAIFDPETNTFSLKVASVCFWSTYCCYCLGKPKRTSLLTV